MRSLKERKHILITPLWVSSGRIIQYIALLVGVMILSSWTHIPFAPVPWNLSFLAVVMLSMVAPLPFAVCAVSLWILIGSYGSWILPYISHPNAPWGGYIWGMLCVAYAVEKLTQIKVRPMYVWLSALCILECASALQYWCVSPNFNYAKHTGFGALFPWHVFQVIIGLSVGRYLKRGLRWMLEKPKDTREITTPESQQ